MNQGRVAPWVGISGALLATTFALISRSVLPARYSLDGLFIQSIAQGHPRAFVDQSYQNAGEAFRLLGLANAPILVALVGMALMCAAVLLAVGEPARLEWKSGFLAGVAIALASVYLSWYSKDVIELIAVCIYLLMTRLRAPVFVRLAPFLIYGILFRSYWVLIVGLALVVIAMWRILRTHMWRWLLFSVLFYALFNLVFTMLSGGDLLSLRAGLNSSRDVGVDAATLISQPFVGQGPVLTPLNLAVVSISFLVPVPLLLKLDVLHSLSALAIFATWLSFLRGVHVGRGVRPVCCSVTVIAAATMVQAIFEPDYGSYVRHLTPLIPVMLEAATFYARPKLTGHMLGLAGGRKVKETLEPWKAS